MNETRWERNRRNALRLRYIASLDAFPPFSTWPSNQKYRFLKDHRNNSDRFDLSKFLLQNGLPPTLLEDFVLTINVDNGRPIYERGKNGKYFRHLAQIKRQWAMGPDCIWINSPYFDLNTRRVV